MDRTPRRALGALNVFMANMQAGIVLGIVRRSGFNGQMGRKQTLDSIAIWLRFATVLRKACAAIAP